MIDTHCHVDMYKYTHTVCSEAESSDVFTIGVTNLPSHFQLGYIPVKRYKNIRLALGLHPLLASQHSKEFALFKKNIDRTTYIGEVGLDFSKHGWRTKSIQIKTFENILKEIAGKDKIVSVHSRGAEREVYELLRRYEVDRVIFHWYSGSLKNLTNILDSGYLLSVNPMMTATTFGKKIISEIPRSQILTETDGPYGVYDNRELRPPDVKIVYEYLSEFWDNDFASVEKTIFSNFMTLVDDSGKHISSVLRR